MMAAGISYQEAGIGAGAPVLCLHGIGGSAESFRSQLDGLTGHRVIAWTMPGYGESAMPPGGLSFAGLSAALSALIAELAPGPVHLVGQSIGGMIALDHALRQPGEVASLTIIGSTPAFGGRDDSFKTAFLKARLAPLEAGQSMAEMARDAAPRLVGPAADANVIAAVAAPMAAVPEATWRAILRCLVTFDRRDDLARVTRPACLIAGGHDQNAPARTMEKMAHALPDAEYHLVKSAGHMINQESPDTVNQIITEFLRRIS